MSLTSASNEEIRVEVEKRLSSTDSGTMTFWRSWLKAQAIHTEIDPPDTPDSPEMKLIKERQERVERWMENNQDKLQLWQWVSWIDGREEPLIFKSYQEAGRVDGRKCPGWLCMEYRGVPPAEYEIGEVED
jgi:hypothetical protein